MAKIIESSKEYQRRVQKEKKDSACPECGKVPLFSCVRTESVGLFGFKTNQVNSHRCSCGCYYEWE